MNNKKKIIILIVILAVISAGFLIYNHIAQANDSGLVGYWKMDENSTGATIYDSSGNGNNGTWAHGTPNNHTTSGVVKRALTFDGSNDYVSCGTKNMGDVDITLAMWIKTSSADFMYVFDGWQVVSPKVQFTISVGTVNKANMYSDTSKIRISSTTSVNDGVWHYIVYQDTGSTMKIFVDGKEEASGNAGSVTYNNWNWNIGRDDVSYFSGSIDEVKIYNRALSAAEVLQNYNASKREYIQE